MPHLRVTLVMPHLRVMPGKPRGRVSTNAPAVDNDVVGSKAECVGGELHDGVSGGANLVREGLALREGERGGVVTEVLLQGHDR